MALNALVHFCHNQKKYGTERVKHNTGMKINETS